MILRLILFAFVAICLAGAAIVFEAASRTALALQMVASASESESAPVRTRLLDRAEASLRTSWARPAEWHAGATEALSGILLLKAEVENDPALYSQSADWAVRTVRLAPVQPHAWTRLAVLAERGHPNPLCDVAACLTKSWRTATMIDPETACVRLQLSYRAGMLTRNDPRIDAYLSSGVTPRDAARCLNFLAPNDLFEVLARAASARR